jgi:hypothetical protein
MAGLSEPKKKPNTISVPILQHINCSFISKTHVLMLLREMGVFIVCVIPNTYIHCDKAAQLLNISNN